MRIALFGDRMVDRYFFLEPLGQDNPDDCSVPIGKVMRIADFDGGAANVETNLVNLGCQVESCYGTGRAIKRRLVLGGKIVYRFDDDGFTHSIYGGIGQMRIAQALERCDAVVVSDYAKGSIDGPLCDLIKRCGKPTFVDCKVNPGWWSSWATAMMPNQSEYLRNRLEYDQSNLLFMKRSELGCSTTHRTGKGGVDQFFPARTVAVLNATGAGDTAVAAFVSAYMLLGHLMELDRAAAAAKFAMDAASVSVSNIETYAPTIDEVDFLYPSISSKKLLEERARRV